MDQHNTGQNCMCLTTKTLSWDNLLALTILRLGVGGQKMYWHIYGKTAGSCRGRFYKLNMYTHILISAY